MQLLVEMFQSDIGRTIGSEELRRQLVVELGTPKEEIEQKQLDRLRKLYEAAYPYLERGMSTQSQPQENERESDQTDAEEEGESGVAPSGESPSQPSGSENVIHIDGLTLQLEGDDVEDEWERAKATIDAYLTSDAS